VASKHAPNTANYPHGPSVRILHEQNFPLAESKHYLPFGYRRARILCINGAVSKETNETVYLEWCWVGGSVRGTSVEAYLRYLTLLNGVTLDRQPPTPESPSQQ